jgi:hypothetical protein
MADTQYVAAVFGLAGSLIGGGITAFVTLRGATQNREEARRTWLKDSRLDVYPKFFEAAQSLHVACERRAADPRPATDEIEDAYSRLMVQLAVVEVLGTEDKTIDPVRSYVYSLLDLMKECKRQTPSKNDAYRLGNIVRDYRHKAISAMREEFGMLTSDQFLATLKFRPFESSAP